MAVLISFLFSKLKLNIVYFKGVKINLVRISKTEFQEMFELGVLDINDKTWHVANKQRPKKKKPYVIEQDYQKYLSMKKENN